MALLVRAGAVSSSENTGIAWVCSVHELNKYDDKNRGKYNISKVAFYYRYLALDEDIPNTPIKFSVRVPVKSLSIGTFANLEYSKITQQQMRSF